MPGIAYSEFEEEVLSLYAPPLRRKATWFKFRKVLQEFRVLPGIVETTDLTPKAIVHWLELHKDRAPMTNRSYLGCLRTACNYAKRMGYLTVTPWDIRRDWVTFDFDDDDDPVPRHLSLAEVDRLLSLLDAEARAGDWIEWRLQTLIYTYLYTGLRKSEALGLKVKDVNLGQGLIRIRSRRERKLKTRTSARLVGVPPDLFPILSLWITRVGSEWLFPGIRRTGPWFHGGPGLKPLDQVKAAGVRAGVPHTTIHAFRRTIATHAKGLGLGELEVKDLLGHGSTQTQEWYLEEDAAALRKMASRIRFPRPGDETRRGA